MTPGAIMRDGLEQVTRGINWVLSLFDELVVKIEIWPLIFAIIASMLIIRFLIYPFLKESVSGSDGVKGNSRYPGRNRQMADRRMEKNGRV